MANVSEFRADVLRIAALSATVLLLPALWRTALRKPGKVLFSTDHLRHRWSLARLSALVKPHAVVELSYSALNTGHSSGEPENDGSWLPCEWRAMYWVNAACSAGRGVTGGCDATDIDGS